MKYIWYPKGDLLWHRYRYHCHHRLQAISTAATIQELAPELMEAIFRPIIADSGDKATLRACSLVFSQHTASFQRALSSKKPLFLPFCRDGDEDPRARKMINTLVDLLDANPRFGASLAPDVVFYFGANPQFLSDPRIVKIARCCSGADSGIVSLTINNMGGSGSWDDLSEENRQALEGLIIHLPRLQNIGLQAIGLPSAVFMRPTSFLESLVVEYADTSTPILPWSIPLPTAKPKDIVLKPICIGCMPLTPIVLRRLAEALPHHTPDADGKDSLPFPIDFGHLRGLVAIRCSHGLTEDLQTVLYRAKKLEELTIRTLDCKSSALLHTRQCFVI